VPRLENNVGRYVLGALDSKELNRLSNYTAPDVPRKISIDKAEDLTFQNASDFTDSYWDYVVKGFKSTGLFGLLAPEEEDPYPEDFGSQLAYGIGHLAGFMTDMSVVGKGIGLVARGAKALNSAMKISDVNKGATWVSSMWNKAGVKGGLKAQQGLLRTGLLKAEQVTGIEKGVNLVPKVGKVLRSTEWAKFSKEPLEVMVSNGATILKGVKAGKDMSVMLSPGPVIQALMFGGQLGARESIAEIVKAERFGIRDAKGNIVKSIDDVTGEDWAKLGLLGKEAFFNEEQWGLLNSPVVRGFKEGAMISGAHQLFKAFLTPHMLGMKGWKMPKALSGFQREGVRTLVSEGVFFGALESMGVEDPEQRKQKFWVGMVMGSALGGIQVAKKGVSFREALKLGPTESSVNPWGIEKGPLDIKTRFNEVTKGTVVLDKSMNVANYRSGKKGMKIWNKGEKEKAAKLYLDVLEVERKLSEGLITPKQADKLLDKQQKVFKKTLGKTVAFTEKGLEIETDMPFVAEMFATSPQFRMLRTSYDEVLADMPNEILKSVLEGRKDPWTKSITNFLKSEIGAKEEYKMSEVEAVLRGLWGKDFDTQFPKFIAEHNVRAGKYPNLSEGDIGSIFGYLKSKERNNTVSGIRVRFRDANEGNIQVVLHGNPKGSRNSTNVRFGLDKNAFGKPIKGKTKGQDIYVVEIDTPTGKKKLQIVDESNVSAKERDFKNVLLDESGNAKEITDIFNDVINPARSERTIKASDLKSILLDDAVNESLKRVFTNEKGPVDRAVDRGKKKVDEANKKGDKVVQDEKEAKEQVERKDKQRKKKEQELLEQQQEKKKTLAKAIVKKEIQKERLEKIQQKVGGVRTLKDKARKLQALSTKSVLQRQGKELKGEVKVSKKDFAGIKKELLSLSKEKHNDIQVFRSKKDKNMWNIRTEWGKTTLNLKNQKVTFDVTGAYSPKSNLDIIKSIKTTAKLADIPTAVITQRIKNKEFNEKLDGAILELGRNIFKKEAKLKNLIAPKVKKGKKGTTYNEREFAKAESDFSNALLNVARAVINNNPVHAVKFKRYMEMTANNILMSRHGDPVFQKEGFMKWLDNFKTFTRKKDLLKKSTWTSPRYKDWHKETTSQEFIEGNVYALNGVDSMGRVLLKFNAGDVETVGHEMFEGTLKTIFRKAIESPKENPTETAMFNYLWNHHYPVQNYREAKRSLPKKEFDRKIIDLAETLRENFQDFTMFQMFHSVRNPNMYHEWGKKRGLDRKTVEWLEEQAIARVGLIREQLDIARTLKEPDMIADYIFEYGKQNPNTLLTGKETPLEFWDAFLKTQSKDTVTRAEGIKEILQLNQGPNKLDLNGENYLFDNQSSRHLVDFFDFGYVNKLAKPELPIRDWKLQKSQVKEIVQFELDDVSKNSKQLLSIWKKGLRDIGAYIEFSNKVKEEGRALGLSESATGTFSDIVSIISTANTLNKKKVKTSDVMSEAGNIISYALKRNKEGFIPEEYLSGYKSKKADNTSLIAMEQIKEYLTHGRVKSNKYPDSINHDYLVESMYLHKGHPNVSAIPPGMRLVTKDGIEIMKAGDTSLIRRLSELSRLSVSDVSSILMSGIGQRPNLISKATTPSIRKALEKISLEASVEESPVFFRNLGTKVKRYKNKHSLQAFIGNSVMDFLEVGDVMGWRNIVQENLRELNNGGRIYVMESTENIALDGKTKSYGNRKALGPNEIEALQSLMDDGSITTKDPSKLYSQLISKLGGENPNFVKKQQFVLPDNRKAFHPENWRMAAEEFRGSGYSFKTNYTPFKLDTQMEILLDVAQQWNRGKGTLTWKEGKSPPRDVKALLDYMLELNLEGKTKHLDKARAIMKHLEDGILELPIRISKKVKREKGKDVVEESLDLTWTINQLIKSIKDKKYNPHPNKTKWEHLLKELEAIETWQRWEEIFKQGFEYPERMGEPGSGQGLRTRAGGWDWFLEGFLKQEPELYTQADLYKAKLVEYLPDYIVEMLIRRSTRQTGELGTLIREAIPESLVSPKEIPEFKVLLSSIPEKIKLGRFVPEEGVKFTISMTSDINPKTGSKNKTWWVNDNYYNASGVPTERVRFGMSFDKDTMVAEFRTPRQNKRLSVLEDYELLKLPEVHARSPKMTPDVTTTLKTIEKTLSDVLLPPDIYENLTRRGNVNEVNNILRGFLQQGNLHGDLRGRAAEALWKENITEKVNNLLSKRVPLEDKILAIRLLNNRAHEFASQYVKDYLNENSSFAETLRSDTLRVGWKETPTFTGKYGPGKKQSKFKIDITVNNEEYLSGCSWCAAPKFIKDGIDYLKRNNFERRANLESVNDIFYSHLSTYITGLVQARQYQNKVAGKLVVDNKPSMSFGKMVNDARELQQYVEFNKDTAVPKKDKNGNWIAAKGNKHKYTNTLKEIKEARFKESQKEHGWDRAEFDKRWRFAERLSEEVFGYQDAALTLMKERMKAVGMSEKEIDSALPSTVIRGYSNHAWLSDGTQVGKEQRSAIANIIATKIEGTDANGKWLKGEKGEKLQRFHESELSRLEEWTAKGVGPAIQGTLSTIGKRSLKPGVATMKRKRVLREQDFFLEKEFKELARIIEEKTGKELHVRLVTSPAEKAGLYFKNLGHAVQGHITFHELNKSMIPLDKNLNNTKDGNVIPTMVVERSTSINKREAIINALVNPNLDKKLGNVSNTREHLEQMNMRDLMAVLESTKQYEVLKSDRWGGRYGDILVYKGAKTLFERAFSTPDFAKSQWYKSYMKGASAIKKLIMYNPLIHTWNLLANTVATSGVDRWSMKDLGEKVKDPKTGKMKWDDSGFIGMLKKHAIRNGWTDAQYERIEKINLADFGMTANILNGLSKVFKKNNLGNLKADPIDLSHPLYQFMVDSGFPIGVSSELGKFNIKDLNLPSKNPFKGLRKMSDDMLWHVVSPATEAYLFYTTFRRMIKSLKQNPATRDWSEEKIKQVAARSSERFSTTLSGKVGKMDMTPMYDAVGNMVMFANHWTVSNFRHTLGMVGLGSNFRGMSGAAKGLQSQYTNATARFLVYKMIMANVLNKAVTDRWTWENEEDKRDRVAVGVDTLPTGEKRYIYADFNRFLNDIWMLTKPSGIKGAAVGALLAKGLPLKGGLPKILGTTAAAVYGYKIGSDISQPLSKAARTGLGLTYDPNAVIPEAEALFRKLNPAFRLMLQGMMNTHSFYKKEIINTDMGPDEQRAELGAFLRVELLPFNRDPLDPAELRAWADGSSVEKQFKGLGLFVSKGQTVSNFQRKLQILDISFSSRKRKIATDHRRYPTAKHKRKALEEEITKYLKMKKELMDKFQTFLKANKDIIEG